MIGVRRIAVRAAAGLVVAAGVAACGGADSASFLIDGTGDHALTLEREQPFLWSDRWNLQLVVNNQPECQRRHALKPAGDGKFRLTVYRTPDGAFILNLGKRWYVTELRSCRLQQYEDEPPAPGEPVGAFVGKGGALRFTTETAADAGPPPAAAPGDTPR